MENRDSVYIVAIVLEKISEAMKLSFRETVRVILVLKLLSIG